jgi:S1 RNA binding domain protein
MQLEVGKIIEGKVCTVAKFGAFIDLGEGKTGLVHISEIAAEYVKDINTYLKPNQIVKVKILTFEKDGRISLSIKKAENLESFAGSNSRVDSNSRAGSFPKNDPNSRSGYALPVKVNFEDRLAKFMKESDDRLNDLKKKMDPKRRKSSKKKVDNL